MKKKTGLRWYSWLFLAFVALLVIGSLFTDPEDDTEKVSIADYPVFNEGDRVDVSCLFLFGLLSCSKLIRFSRHVQGYSFAENAIVMKTKSLSR